MEANKSLKFLGQSCRDTADPTMRVLKSHRLLRQAGCEMAKKPHLSHGSPLALRAGALAPSISKSGLLSVFYSMFASF